MKKVFHSQRVTGLQGEKKVFYSLRVTGLYGEKGVLFPACYGTVR